jgi:hypothetical protein
LQKTTLKCFLRTEILENTENLFSRSFCLGTGGDRAKEMLTSILELQCNICKWSFHKEIDFSSPFWHATLSSLACASTLLIVWKTPFLNSVLNHFNSILKWELDVRFVHTTGCRFPTTCWPWETKNSRSAVFWWSHSLFLGFQTKGWLLTFS